MEAQQIEAIAKDLNALSTYAAFTKKHNIKDSDYWTVWTIYSSIAKSEACELYLFEVKTSEEAYGQLREMAPIFAGLRSFGITIHTRVERIEIYGDHGSRLNWRICVTAHKQAVVLATEAEKTALATEYRGGVGQSD